MGTETNTICKPYLAKVHCIPRVRFSNHPKGAQNMRVRRVG